MILTRLFLFFFIFFSCSSSYEKTISQVEPPWGYVFTEWNGAPIDVITYIPPNATPGTPILMVIPGASRDAQRFHASWLDLAKKNHFSVIGINIKSNNREIKEWDQPIIKGKKLAFVGFVICQFNKTNHYLCRYNKKPGLKTSTLSCSINTSDINSYKKIHTLSVFQKKLLNNFDILRLIFM